MKPRLDEYVEFNSIGGLNFREKHVQFFATPHAVGQTITNVFKTGVCPDDSLVEVVLFLGIFAILKHVKENPDKFAW